MKRLVFFAYFVVYVVWGATYLAISFGIETMPPSLLLGLRYLFAGAINSMIYYIWSLATDAPPLRLGFREVSNAAITGCILLIGGTGLIGWAQQTVDSHFTAMIIASAPLWVTVVDTILSGKLAVSPRQIFGMVLGLLSCVIMAVYGSSRTFSGLGISLLFLATVFWAAASSLSKIVKLPANVMLTSGLQLFAGGAVMLLIGSLLGEIHPGVFSSISKTGWIALVYLVIFSSCLAFTAFAWLLTLQPKNGS